jgi:hypothetical protein
MGPGLTLHKPRAALRKILNDHIPPPVPQQTVERRQILMLCNVVADLDNAAIASRQKLYLVATCILEQKPVVAHIARSARCSVPKNAQRPGLES